MIVDIGGGTTDIAVISLAGIVYSKAVRVAGNEMDEAIIQYIRKTYNLLIGERTAEAIKIEIGSAFPLEERMTMEIKGRHLIEGVPKTITITDEEIREALTETVNVMLGHILLISAQVNSKSGVPILEAVTFGLFSEVQRGASSFTGGVHNAWTGYANLRGVRAENERLKQQIGTLQVQLQQERAAAQ